MQDGRKAVWSIPYASVAFFPSLKHNFIAYRFSLTDSLPSLNLLCYSKTDARFMQDGLKAVWSIPYVSVAFFQV